MPGGDRSGPMGRGALTGRGAGPCAGYRAVSGFEPRMGRGAGWGRGRGRRYVARATGMPGWMRADAAERIETLPERAALETQVAALASELTAIKKRLEDLDGAE
jgi:hypothetical protein